MQMIRTFSLLLTIVFLGAQMLSFAHAAECGSREHKHEGAECEICLSVKYQGYAGHGATSEIHVLHRTRYVPQPLADVIVVQDACEAGITRGPPISS